MLVRIFKREKNSTQSGLSKNTEWVLQPVSQRPSLPDSLMGWHGRGDHIAEQVTLTFATQEKAIQFAASQGYSWITDSTDARVFKTKSYSDNFSANRRVPWTH